MTTKKNDKKKSAARKLIPAIGMLTVSAMMLSSSTYAWFTMSREVEVTGINMTATVPEDLQISLGTLGTAVGTAATSDASASLKFSTGILVADNGTSADDGGVKAPSNMWDWSNSADISAYYEFGKLIPASSTDGTNIYFTPDADGVGKTVDGEADYVAAALANAAQDDANTTATDNQTYKATLHAATLDNKTAAADSITTSWLNITGDGKRKYTPSTKWNVTKDDGYYVDIPVWIRSSSSAATGLTVKGYVLPMTKDNKPIGNADIELYKAVRVAILNGDAVTQGDAGTTIGKAIWTDANIIPLYDAFDVANSGKTTAADGTISYTSIASFADKYSNGNATVDSVNYTTRTDGVDDDELWGVKSVATDATASTKGGTAYHKATYGEFETYDNTSADKKTIATIVGTTSGQEYGTAKKLIIRVWLDGEDGECWNKNAGQDFAISLRFDKIET